MIKYKAEVYSGAIERAEVVRETKHNVFFSRDGGRSERREAKESEFCGYFDTWEEAHSLLLEKAGVEVEYTRAIMNAAEKTYERISGMKK